MEKRYLAALACICAFVIAAAGCGGSSAGNSAPEAAQSDGAAQVSAAAAEGTADAGVTSDTAAETSYDGETGEFAEAERDDGDSALDKLRSTALETYESEDGWSVRYDSELISVRDVWNGTEFAYTGDQNGTNKLVIKYYPNTSTDIVLADKTEDYSGSWLERSEGYFAGRADIWAFHVDVIRNGWRSTLGYTAVEHNDGVLLIEKTGSVESDEERGILISDTMADILDSFEFADHEPQTEYDYIPGEYVLESGNTSEDTGASAVYPGKLVLREDHTGQLGDQDPVEIMWYSRDGIIREDKADGEVRFFHIEGESLYLEQGDEWIEYRKNLGMGQSVDGLAADSRTPATFRTYENDDGWLVYYDSDLFTINESYNRVEFVYMDSADEAGRLKVRYYEDDSTEDVLEDIEDDYSSEQVERSEGYFGGSREDWAFTLSVPYEGESSGMRKIYTAAEHNDGVLLVERIAGGENDTEREKAIEEIAGTFLFTDHDPQREYEDIPGRYLLNDKILAKDAGNYPRRIILNWDHTGVMSGLDDIDIIWHCLDGILKEAAAGGKTYYYYIDDDVLYLHMDGERVQFEREDN